MQKLANKIAGQLKANQSYEDFAKATAIVLKDHYGEHLYTKFIEAMEDELKSGTIHENSKKSLGHIFGDPLAEIENLNGK